MAESTYTFKIIWENGVKFELKGKGDEEDGWRTVVLHEEDGNLARLWEKIQSVCEDAVKMKLSSIGAEMKT